MTAQNNGHWRSLALAVGLACAFGVQTVEAQNHAPRQRHVAVDDIARLGDIDALYLSPDGRSIAFVQRQADPVVNGYVSTWYVMPATGGPLTRIGDAGDAVLPTASGMIFNPVTSFPAIWSHDSQWILYPRAEGPQTEIWRARRDGARADRLTALPPSSDVSLRLMHRGTALFVHIEPKRTAAERDPSGARQGYLYDERFVPSYSLHPTIPRQGEDQGELFVIDLARASVRAASAQDRLDFEQAGRSDPRMGADAHAPIAHGPSGALAWTEARDQTRQGGMPPLSLTALAGGSREAQVCAAVECEGQRILGVWWLSEHEILFARGEGLLLQDQALYTWRVGEPTVRSVLRTPDRLIDPSGGTCVLSGLDLVCLAESADVPERIVAIDTEDGARYTLYDPNPDFSSFDLGAGPRRLESRSSSGVLTYGYLLLPPERTDRPLPLVVVTYRCDGFLRGGVGDEYPIYPLAAQGFAVFCFNAPDTDLDALSRMSWDDYIQRTRGPDDLEKRNVQEALDSAIARLIADGIADPDRIAVTGLSFGAETVSYALFHMPQLTAAIASGTEMGPAGAFLFGPAGEAMLNDLGLGAPDSQRWDDLSLSRNAARVHAPLLLNVADRELLLGLEAAAALRRQGRAVELYVFEDEYHIKWQPAHRLAIYNRNVDWMNFWLRGVESGLTGDPEQYVRWRAMRENQCPLFGPGGTEYRTDAVPWYCRPAALEEPAH